MSKKPSTIENRVYLFRDLASAWLVENGAMLCDEESGTRQRAMRALADLAYVSCVLADTEKDDAGAVARAVAERD
jgi:hypothetical protein